MARQLPQLPPKIVAQVFEAAAGEHPPWARKRLNVAMLLAQRVLTVAEIMEAAGVSRQTVFTYRDKLLKGGVTALLRRRKPPGRPKRNPPSNR